MAPSRGLSTNWGGKTPKNGTSICRQQCLVYEPKNTVYSQTTKYSPYYLMFGREARYPSEVPTEYEVTEDRVEHLMDNEEVFGGLLHQMTTYAQVTQNVKKSQEKIRKRKLERGLEDNFKVGDVVLKKNIREEQRKGGKMDSDMLGPFTVTAIKGKLVSLTNANTKTVANVDQLVHYQEPEERIPAKLRKASSSPLAHPLPQPPSNPSMPAHAISSPGPLPATCQGTTHPIHSNVVQDIWLSSKGEVLWSKIGPYKLFTADMQSLAPERELVSEILNSYLLWGTRKVPNKRIYVIDSFEMTAIWNGTSRGMRKLDVTEWDMLIGAVCKDRHWTLVAMYPKDRRALFVDPFGATQTQLTHCRDATRAFMRKKDMGLNLSRWSCETVVHPRQQDSTSCGVLVCKVAELLLEGSSIDFNVDQVSIGMMRMQMARTLIDDSGNLTDLCRICGEKESGDRDTSDAPVDQWIECTRCSFWFHWVCVARPNMKGIFLCPACSPPT
ncbi:uncharacterized protein LOC126408578 [Epinephelus moara]|uniref:uncharacterized protein LOC126408578 n=1 Tax=Epinephelus moara TaxID=300413 RepID=UPI00214DFCB9|nr:uncharacterized protein LOC126408578 [Epinephelus moara]